MDIDRSAYYDDPSIWAKILSRRIGVHQFQDTPTANMTFSKRWIGRAPFTVTRYLNLEVWNQIGGKQ